MNIFACTHIFVQQCGSADKRYITVYFPKSIFFRFWEIELRKQNGSDPKAAPAASALFVRVEVRYQLQRCEVLVGDFVQLLQGAVGQIPQLGFVLVQVIRAFR